MTDRVTNRIPVRVPTLAEFQENAIKVMKREGFPKGLIIELARDNCAASEQRVKEVLDKLGKETKDAKT